MHSPILVAGFVKVPVVAILVPLILGGIALAVMAIVSMLASRQKRRGKQTNAQTRILIHAINDDRCTGCDACVAVCPTNVLDLVQNKSRVLRFQDCIQCEACMWACPTEALVMFPEGNTPPPVKVPNIDGYYQTAIPGQYLIGEVAGKPLVKNAANLGRAVIEHMLQTGLHPSPQSPAGVDVIIVGSGPGGMSAALSCVQRGLSYLILEKENMISSTVSRYPKGKHIMAEPYDVANLSLLPIFDTTKEKMVELWQELAKSVDLKIRLHESVELVQKQQDGSFLTQTTSAQYRSQRVVLATGTRGKPRTLGARGEHLPKVESLLEDPQQHRGKAVCVVGGGDSALEAALALSSAGGKVILSYRGRSFHRAQAKNRQKIEAMSAEGRIKIKLQSEVVEFAEETVTLQMADGTQKRYPNHAAFVLIGAAPPIQWLSTLGISYVERPHMQPMPASDAMVKQLIPSATQCPENAANAAELIFGRAISPQRERQRQAERPVVAQASVGRRFVRSASALFRLGEDKDVMPGLAQANSRGDSRRDELEPGERTRILRMLRDEGGRHADEDSKVYRVDNLLEEERTDENSPLQSSAPIFGEQENAPLLSTLPPASPGAPPPSEQPRQALIVGLARASVGANRKRRTRPVPHPDMATPAQNPVTKLKRPLPVMEEPTNLMHFDPAEMMREAEREHAGGFPSTPTIQDDPTRDIDVDALIADADQGGRLVDYEDSGEERTLIVDENFEPRSLSEVEWDID